MMTPCIHAEDVNFVFIRFVCQSSITVVSFFSVDFIIDDNEWSVSASLLVEEEHSARIDGNHHFFFGVSRNGGDFVTESVGIMGETVGVW